MPLYLNELAPWERKSEYYSNIQMGKDVNHQIEVLSESTKAMIATQIASTNAVVVSQERVSEGIGDLSYKIGEIREGIYELKAAFEWGISEIVWQIEQNRQVLRSILEVLMAPLDTQAKELRYRAEDAYKNGWYDDALEDFLGSELKNRYDFSVHISIGMIYLFYKKNKEKALEYFERAIKYAKPKSQYHASYALLYKGLIMRDYGRIDEAVKCTQEAIELSDKLAEAYYQNAQYNSQLKNTIKSIKSLEFAIRGDRNYCIKADNDPMFDPIRGDVNELFERLRDDEKEKAINYYKKLLNRHHKLVLIVEGLSKENIIDDSYSNGIRQIQNQLTDLDKKIKRDTYFDFLDINTTLISQLQKGQDKLIANLETKVQRSVSGCESNFGSIKNSYKESMDRIGKKLSQAILIGSFAVPIITCLIAGRGDEKLWIIPFLIPFISQFYSIIFLYLWISGDPKPGPSLGGSRSIIAKSITVFIIISIISIIIFFIYKSLSKAETDSDIKKQTNVKELILEYLDKIKNIKSLS